MDPVRFGLGVRALRHRRRWTQAELGHRARISPSGVSRIERGQADRAALHTLWRLAAVLGARVDLRLLWQGEGLDRLLDSRHATLVDRTLNLLERHAWETATEVSFSIRGERGSIDVLAFHRSTRSLLVVEVKSVVPDLQGMLVALDRKGRLAREIGRERDWSATSVTRLLVLGTTERPDVGSTRSRPPSAQLCQPAPCRSDAGSVNRSGCRTGSCSCQMTARRALVTAFRPRQAPIANAEHASFGPVRRIPGNRPSSAR